ncbi:AI-2E family transporter [Draconibacterium sp.]
MKNKTTNSSVYDITIRMFFLFLIVAWCLFIMLPFVHILLWGMILGIAFMPMHNSLTKIFGGKPKLASTVIVLLSLVIIIIPSMLFLDSVIHSIKELKEAYTAGTLTIPPPSEQVKTWPLIGEKIYDAWSTGSNNLEQFIIKYKEQLTGIGKKIGAGLLSATSGVFQMIGAVIIAGILLVVQGLGESARKFFRKVAGKNGDHFADIAKLTIGNVVKGVLGVALIQALLIGIGFLLAGIPLAGLWTILVLVLAILQLPAIIVIIPIAVFMFSEKETVPAVIWTVYLILAGLSDNVLKPVLLGKGAPVPMLVIFIGVVGGFIFSGFIGLFTGSIVMSIGYKLYVGWINSTDNEETESITE